MDIILHSKEEPNNIKIRFRADLFLHSFVVADEIKEDEKHYADIIIKETKNETSVFIVTEYQYNELNDQMDLYNQKTNY